MDLTGFIEKIDRFPKNLDAVEMKRQIAELDIELHKLTSNIPIHHSELQWIKVKLGFIGEFNFPLLKQGKTSTIDVFCAPDLVLFLSYYKNRMSKNIFLDIGANIGSTTPTSLPSKCYSFEPDHKTYPLGKLFLEKNSCDVI